MRQPIIVKGTRILTPEEYILLRRELNPDQKVILDCLLLTGMRYAELQRFHDHPDWYDEESGFIHLPPEAVLKGRKIKNPDDRQRWVRTSDRAKGTIPALFKVKMPTRVSFDQMLRRKAIKALDHSGLNPEKISTKSMRKTLASWLRIYYPNAYDYIYESLGHGAMTELKHYLGHPFTEKDKADMREWIAGWI